ncbi:MAG: 30S ribosomal protein S18 [Mycoplasmataceae bacterium]|jgi:small subunit ribosomal protein S18|nr:30S ribosomal protein S18 [Mycoplasmataceae bacterium]
MLQRTNIQRKRKFFIPKKPCVLCQQGVNYVDYKNTELLKHYLSHTAKILPRRVTGACAYHQRMIANAIKRARYIGLLPFVAE